MIQAQMLPPSRSVYDYPVVLPDQEMTEEQQNQANVAQVAAIVLAAAAGKKALTDAVTNQIVALLRVTDLYSETAVKVFAKQAAYLVRLAVRESQMISWSSVAARAAVVDIELSTTPPSESEIPSELRYSRGTDLETAYTRLAEEYRGWRERTREDPRIALLIDEMEYQGISPLPRPDNITDDAIQRVTNGEEAWREAFAKASEEALEAEGRTLTIFETEEEETEARFREELAERRAAREPEPEGEGDASGRSSGRAGDSDRSSGGQGSDSESGSGGADSGDRPQKIITLTQAEIDALIERHAQQKVEERAERMVSHDVQAAARNMHQVAMRQLPQKKVIGFRRVVHPELAKSGRSCGLCIVASTMWYTRRDLLPIHAGCNCETCEIYDLDGVTFDPGNQINMEDLEVFYREAGNSTHGWDLKRSQYEVIDHPEYGPTLINAKSKRESNKRRFESVPFERKEVRDDD